MSSGYYAAFTGLVARMQALDVLANNLANVNTTGFRGQHEFYRAVTASLSSQPLTALNRSINDFAVLGGSIVDQRQGSLQATGNNLDLGMSGPGFFSVLTPRGTRFTRNGSFHLDTSGRIVDENNDPVLGPGGPINLPPGDVAISEDGTISVAGAVAAQVRVAEFVPGTVLTPEGESNFIVPAGADLDATTSKVEQGMLESSNVKVTLAMTNLMVLQRHAELLERTLSIFQNDFDRTAVQQLAVD
ncbi:MAG: flagellar hook basal-body protein [Candidatus Acidiferrales bacterium]